MFDVVGGLVVNDLPSLGKCAAIPHSKHQPLQPTERIKAHNHRSSQGGTVIGRNMILTLWPTRQLLRTSHKSFTMLRRLAMEVTVEYLGKVLAMEVQA